MAGLVLLATALALGAVALFPGTLAAKDDAPPKPTVVFVHGAFAESASWNGTIAKLQSKGYKVIAAANPLRSVGYDSSYVGSVVASVRGPVVLVGHSYGGVVISNAATGHDNVRALVYVGAFAPDAGENALALSGKFPGSSLGQALSAPVPIPTGGNDLYITQEKFHAQFAADVPEAETKLMAATQRPVTQAALNEPSGEPAWKGVPSWFVYGGKDKNIPPALHAYMAKRAKAKRSVEVPGASHVVMVSHPDEVAKIIDEAATEVMK